MTAQRRVGFASLGLHDVRDGAKFPETAVANEAPKAVLGEVLGDEAALGDDALVCHVNHLVAHIGIPFASRLHRAGGIDRDES